MIKISFFKLYVEDDINGYIFLFAFLKPINKVIIILLLFHHIITVPTQSLFVSRRDPSETNFQCSD